MTRSVETIRKYHGELRELRRDIHAHPELAFEENRTSQIVAERLASWGIEVHRGIAKTGVVGVVHGKKNGSGRGVGLRADMDCLPMHETSNLAYKSTHAGRMHACGHDGHTAMLLAAAKHLSKHRSFDGTVYLVFQPAEEGVPARHHLRHHPQAPAHLPRRQSRLHRPELLRHVPPRGPEVRLVAIFVPVDPEPLPVGIVDDDEGDLHLPERRGRHVEKVRRVRVRGVPPDVDLEERHLVRAGELHALDPEGIPERPGVDRKPRKEARRDEERQERGSLPHRQSV